MNFTDKLQMGTQELLTHGAATLVAFGDSVTHGALGTNEFDYETVYWNRLKKRINALYPYVPVNALNAGIGGVTAAGSVARLERDVLSHHPDLIIICFGLNDVNGDLNTYLQALRTIFFRCCQSGAQVIFMTPNMLNTYVAEDTAPDLREYAEKTAEMQNGGRMDRFMREACALAAEYPLIVCDCYARWKALAATGEDTTKLLVNRINHPIREMHALFSDSLFDVLFSGIPIRRAVDTDAMFPER